MEKSVELLHNDGTPWCSLPDLPDDRWHHTQTGLEACGGGGGYIGGGYMGTSCIKFSGGMWKPSHKLKKERTSHSSWAAPRGTVLMGGMENGMESGKTTELLDDTSRVSISIMHFPLKYEIW